MLAQEVVRRYGDSVRFVAEDLGASALAASFGVDKYPAIFVDDALVARPEDFYSWGGPESGKYLPWSDEANRRKFQADLARMIDIRLAGGVVGSLPKSASAPKETDRRLPDVPLEELDGSSLRFSSLRGKPLLIEFWAPWCPHCMRTLAWMKTLDRDSVEIVAIAIESPREDVARAVENAGIPGHVVMASPDVRAAFGGPPAIPTLLLADANGVIAKVFYGAPPTLHDDVERELGRLGSTKKEAGRRKRDGRQSSP